MTVTMLILIGVLAWLAIVVLVLALLRAAARADDAADRQRRWLLEQQMPEPPVPHRPRDARGFTGRVQQRLDRLDTQPEAILGLMLDVAARDPAAARHAAAVAHYARALARATGLPEREQGLAHTAGLLHDIGILTLLDAHAGARDSLEPDPELVRRHPTEGGRLLQRTPTFRELGDIVVAHHERVDGAGYPRGLHGEQIPRLARILAVAEVYDTLSAPDSYRGGLDDLLVRSELRRAAAGQLDRELVEIFLASVVPYGGEGTKPERPRLAQELRATHLA